LSIATVTHTLLIGRIDLWNNAAVAAAFIAKNPQTSAAVVPAIRKRKRTIAAVAFAAKLVRLPVGFVSKVGFSCCSGSVRRYVRLLRPIWHGDGT
jgi:hypothetical protein